MRNVVKDSAFIEGKAPEGQNIGRKNGQERFSSPIGATYFAPMGLGCRVVSFIATDMSPLRGLTLKELLTAYFHNTNF